MILNRGLPHSKTHILNQDGGSLPGRALQGTNAQSLEKLGRCPEQSPAVDRSRRATRLGSPLWSLWEWVLFVEAHRETVISEDLKSENFQK